MNEKTSKINPNGQALVEALVAHKGETLAFAELANLAGVEAKTGYLTAAKKIASDRKLKIEKVENGITLKAVTVITYPNGFKSEKAKEIQADGYRIVDAE